MRWLWYFFLIGVLGIGGAAKAQMDKPFILPVAAPPGASTWLLGQGYGNTVGAYLNGTKWYEAGQQLHFGLDFWMPCGTPLVAVADGEVGYVDDKSFGSGPHNLILKHPQLGVSTLYGHLLQTPVEEPGEHVMQGEVVALSGDPDGTCDSRPHLHFEVRSLDYSTTYNPVSYINANWSALTTIGAYSYPLFEQNLDNARQWMTIDNQPDVHFWGKPLNNYAAPYPDFNLGLPPANPPLAVEAAPLPDHWQMRRLTEVGCCATFWWSGAQRLQAIDGSPGVRASIFEWDTTQPGSANQVGPAPPPLTSPDGSLQVERVKQQIVIRRIADGSSWTVDTQNTLPAISADNSRLLWEIDGETNAEIWISDLDGTNAQRIVVKPRAYGRWLDGSRVLIGVREHQTTTLAIYDASDGSSFVLGSWDWLRGLSVAPGGGRLAFYLVAQSDPAQDGIYVLTTQRGAPARHLPFFGAWRWRNADTLLYILFDPAQPGQTLRYYDLVSGADRQLAVTPFRVANGSWAVNGDQVVFWSADDLALWLIASAP